MTSPSGSNLDIFLVDFSCGTYYFSFILLFLVVFLPRVSTEVWLHPALRHVRSDGQEFRRKVRRGFREAAELQLRGS